MAIRKVPAAKGTTKVGQPYFIPWDDELKALYVTQQKPAGKTKDDKLSMSKAVKDWFRRAAIESGWDAASPVRNVGDQVGAGFVVWKSDPSTQSTKPETPAKPAKSPKPAVSKVRLFLVLRDITEVGDDSDED